MDNLSAYRLVCFLNAVQTGQLLVIDPQWSQPYYAEIQRLAIPGNVALPEFDYTVLLYVLGSFDRALPTVVTEASNPSHGRPAIQSINRHPCQHCKGRKKKVGTSLRHDYCSVILAHCRSISSVFRSGIISANDAKQGVASSALTYRKGYAYLRLCEVIRVVSDKNRITFYLDTVESVGLTLLSIDSYWHTEKFEVLRL